MNLIYTKQTTTKNLTNWYIKYNKYYKLNELKIDWVCTTAEEEMNNRDESTKYEKKNWRSEEKSVNLILERVSEHGP